MIRAANGYIDRQAPWALRKTDPARMAAVLRVLVDVLRPVATVLQPFMPGSMAAMLDQLGVPPDARQLRGLAHAVPGGTVCRRRRASSRATCGGSRLMLVDSHCHLDMFAGELRRRPGRAPPRRASGSW